MENMRYYNRCKTVPESAKKEIQSGRLKGKTDINPMYRIKTMTEIFGPCGIGWYYKVTKQWMEPYEKEIAAFVNIELYIKENGEWSQPIFGVGGSMFVTQETKGMHISDECFKMATTDAISVACKQLGVAADVYWDKDKTKYSTSYQDTEDFETADPVPGIDEDRLKPVYNELIRIGYSTVSLCRTYKIDDISKMSNLQIKDFLSKAKKMPDKKKAEENT